MLHGMRPFIVRWLITTAAIFITAPLVGIHYDGIGCLLGAALLLGIVNAFVRPIVLLLSLPLIVFTLGFGILIVNALMLCFVSGLIPWCFHVESFGGALMGAILISVVSWLLSIFFKASDGRVRIITHHEQIKQVRGRVIE